MCKDLYFAKQVQFFLSSLSQTLVSLEKSCKHLEVELHCKDRFWSSFWRLVTVISDLWGSEPEGKGSRKPGMEQAWNRVVERVSSCLSDCLIVLLIQAAGGHFWAWNETCLHLPALFYGPEQTHRFQSRVSKEAKASWASAESVKFHMNLLEAYVVCNERWKVKHQTRQVLEAHEHELGAIGSFLRSVCLAALHVWGFSCLSFVG